jgi:hypothetical protein
MEGPDRTWAETVEDRSIESIERPYKLGGICAESVPFTVKYPQNSLD